MSKQIGQSLRLVTKAIAVIICAPVQRCDSDRNVLSAFVLVTMVCTVYYALFVPVVLDDAFVYFRVVQRFVATGTPTFNDGDTGNITTSPLWLAILTALHKVIGGVSVVSLSKAASVILMIGASWLLFRILVKRLSAAAPFSAVAVFFAPSMNTLIGHDTALALFCALGVVEAFVYDRRSLPVWIALLYLARGEGAVFGAIVAGTAVFCRRPVERIKRYFGPALIGGALIAAWHGLHLYNFGQLLPSTLEVKRLQVEAGFQSFAAMFWTHLGWSADQATISVVLATVVGLTALAWKTPLLVLWPMVHFITYAVLRVPYYHWYYYPIDFIRSLAVVVAVALFVDFARRLLLRGVAPNRMLQIAAFALTIVVVVGVHPVVRAAVVGVSLGAESARLSDRRFVAYTELSARMREFAGRSDFTVLTHEIGIFGYLLPQAHIRDVVGLATRIGTKSEMWNWDGRAAEFDPDFTLWPFPDPPRYLVFGVKSKTPIKVYERDAVAGNAMSFTLYRRAERNDSALGSRIAALEAMLAGAMQVSAPLEGIGLSDGIGLFSHAPSRIRLDVPDGANAVTVRFGYRDGAWQGSNEPDGAIFSVQDTTTGVPMFSRRLDPKRVTSDRGPQSTTIALPVGLNQLNLIIDPGQTPNWDWTYWSTPDWNLGPRSATAMVPVAPDCPAAASVLAQLVSVEAGWLDESRTVNRSLFLRGWAADLAVGSPAAEIVVLAGGRTIACGKANRPRPDVAAAKKVPGLLQTGFEIVAPAGPDISVFARLVDGRYARLNSTP